MLSSNDISFYIQQNILWTQLPSNVRSKLNNESQEYSKAVFNHSLQNQLRFKSSLISKITKNERRYYEKLLSHSRDHMFLYPYHLQDIMVSGLKTTPFMYYIDMLCHLMSQERSYDFIPNFTAADCLRLLGIGRNQYIDLMNNLRGFYSSNNNSTGAAVSMVNAGRRFLGLSTANPRKDLVEKIRSLLPQSPVETVLIEPWWLVSIGIVLESDIESSSQSTKDMIDYIIDQGPVVAAMLNREELKHLYLRGMVYLDVPIESNATISVPTLEGFVMNRTTGDYFETLLYKIFVAIDENSTVENLAQILEIPLYLVQQAISVFCRLQFAHKKPNSNNNNSSSNNQSSTVQHSSWNGIATPVLKKIESSNVSEMENFLLEENEEDLANDNGSCNVPNMGIKYSDSMFMSPSPSSEIVNSSGKFSSSFEENSPPKKIAFIFDSSLTAYLMMGNLSVGLKNHAVTMFEVGKLSEESLDSFLNELDQVSDVGEGEAQRYYEHAVNLRHTIRKLRSIAGHGIDLLRCGSLFSLDCASRTRMLTKNYRCLISMAPINYLSNSESGQQNISNSNTARDSNGLSRSEMAISTNPELPHFGPVIPEVTSVWFKLFLYSVAISGPPTLLLTNGYRLRTIPKQFKQYSKLLLTPWQQESVVISMNCALVTINDALTHSPLLVQGFDDFDSSITEKHLIFPTDFERIPSKKLQELVTKLDHIIDLTNKCGYISYLEVATHNRNKTAPETAHHQQHSNNGDDDILLLHIHFGVPLFDHEINQSVLDQLSKMQMFCVDTEQADSEKQMKISDQYQTSTRKLAIRLLEFIDQHGGGSNNNLSISNDSSESSINNNSSSSKNSVNNNSFNCMDRCNVSFSEIPLPTRNLFFHHDKIEYFF